MSGRKDLSSSVCYLPLNIQSRVELWLTYSGIKQCSLILARKSKGTKIFSWLKEAKLSFSINPKDKNQIFISTDQNVVKKLAVIWQENSQTAEYKKGLLLGYPINAVKAFSTYSSHPKRQKYLTSIAEATFPKTQINYYPYISYTVRRGKEIEDSQVAQKWSECIRKEVPKLAYWYEKAIIDSLQKKHS